MEDAIEKARLLLSDQPTREPIPFQIGVAPESHIIRKPIFFYPDYSSNYSEFLNDIPMRPLTAPVIGSSFDPNAKICHQFTRNRFFASKNHFFEAFNSSIRMFDFPLTSESFSSVRPSISTRSFCSAFSISPSQNFGCALSHRSIITFEIEENNFKNVTFLKPDSYANLDPSSFMDISCSSFINEEYCTISSNGNVFLFNGDHSIFHHHLELLSPYLCVSCAFANHPRVGAFSFPNFVSLIDFRESTTNDISSSGIPIEIPLVSSICSYDIHQLALASPHSVYLIDLRFPTKTSASFIYDFASPAVSLTPTLINEFPVIISHSSASGEVVIFPFNQVNYAAPLRPFDVVMKQYIDNEPSFLTGFSLINNNNEILLQYENGAIIKFEFDDQPPSRHFFSHFCRKEDEAPRDSFEFHPSFETIPSQPTPKTNFNWKAFPEINEPPPDNLLYESPSNDLLNEPPPDGDKDYLIEFDGGLELDEASANEALVYFWSSHIRKVTSTLFPDQ